MPRDPGLQPERTRLAWRRSALALTGVTVLALRLAITRGTLGALLAAATLLGWATLVVVGSRRIAALRTPVATGPTVPLAALLVAGFAVIGLVLVVTGVGPAPR
ncbi:protein of unknown function [Micromonospora pattaloongensis]|uniref:DUF202 domain-containing protein n=1 Tax=Micromonospora pattaloongensis TaxID=405436 RepID=A0A1H3FH36_9ACTN|nr:DUF202 domain-containing protein [Micromonospora pattaloongensis]SDX90240.1 protein of unknown function [Micromonospora pattaloongensis]